MPINIGNFPLLSRFWKVIIAVDESGKNQTPANGSRGPALGRIWGLVLFKTKHTLDTSRKAINMVLICNSGHPLLVGSKYLEEWGISMP